MSRDKKKWTKRTATARMLEIGKIGDTETAHLAADELVIEVLKEIGWKKFAKAYDDVSKWYS
jgi:hypothetical protein